MEISLKAFKESKKAQVSAAIIAGASIAIYAGSPFLAIVDFSRALSTGNADKASSYIDFPLLRESLKVEAIRVVSNNINNDPDMANNPFSGAAIALAGPIINTVIDNYVTPSGLKRLLEMSLKKTSGETEADLTAAERLNTVKKALEKTNVGYKTLNTFQVQSKDRFDRGLSMIFRREGFASWKLVEIELPSDGFYSP